MVKIERKKIIRYKLIELAFKNKLKSHKRNVTEQFVFNHSNL